LQIKRFTNKNYESCVCDESVAVDIRASKFLVGMEIIMVESESCDTLTPN